MFDANGLFFSVLKVTIAVTYNPPSDFTLPSPPYYRPATSVTLTCQAHHATGTVSYRWSSTCSSCFASSSTAQSISNTILKSIDAGVHTCTATDGSGNIGSNSTEMKLIGMKEILCTIYRYVGRIFFLNTGVGFYVSSSNYLNSVAVANNSLIVRKSSSCYNCRVDVYCYSNSTSSSAGYYIFPNYHRKSSDNDHYDYAINRQTHSGIRIHSSGSQNPDIWGIFVCELPDSEGNTVENSIGIYSSMPSK